MDFLYIACSRTDVYPFWCCRCKHLCIKGLLPARICSRRYLKISCPVLGVGRVRGVSNYRNLMVSLSWSHFLSLLGWYFQIIKDNVGQASPPHHSVDTLIFCSLCGCLEDVATGQLQLYKMSTVICSSLIMEIRKQGGRQGRDIFRSLLGKGQSVQKVSELGETVWADSRWSCCASGTASKEWLWSRKMTEIPLPSHAQNSRSILPLQKCVAALTGKFTSLSSCQSVADWFSMYASAREAIVATMIVEWFKGCNASWRFMLRSTVTVWTVVASAFPFILWHCWIFGS